MIQKLLLSVRSVFLKFSDFQIGKTFTPNIKLVCLGMFFVVSIANATDYYSKSTGNLNLFTSWGTNVNGSGTAPTSFTAGGDVFYIRNNATPTIGGSWIVSGAGSKIVLGNGTNACNFSITGANTVTGTMDISSNATLTISSSATSSIVFGVLSPNSTVNYARGGNQTVLSGVYENLTFSGSGTKTLGAAITTNGALTVSNNTSLAMSSYLLTLNGNLIETGSGTVTGGTGGVTISGANNQSIAGFTTTGTVSIRKTGGVATMTGVVTGNIFNVGSGPYLNLGSFTHATNTLTFAGVNQDIGSWGSTSSVATYKNNTYFAPSSGVVTVGRSYTSFNFSNVRPITNVVFNALSNASSALLTSPAYENYTNYKTSVTVGQSYTIAVQGNTDGDYTYYYQVFFDWNQDGDFLDSGEPFNISTIRNSNGIDGKTASNSIAVPLNAAQGTTRMRVISHYNSYNTTPNGPDGNSYGQVEDYSINIEGACSTPAPGATLSTANPVCSNVPFTLSVENPSTGGTGYQWETSTDNATWNNATPGPVTIIDTDFSTTPTNAIVLGNTSITGGELILTPAVASRAGGYFINTSPGSNITPFTASFDFRMFDGDAADGMSLSYGPASSISNSTAGGGEEGEGTGFILKFDTYDNVTGVGSGSMIRILYAGAQIFANSLNPFNLRNASYRTANLTVDVNGLLSLKIGATTIVSGLSVPNYVSADKTNWKFKFSARTGAQFDKQSIDKITIVCGDVLSSNATYTTTQVIPTRYRAKVTCGSTSVYSTPVLVNMISAVIQPKITSTCSNTGFTITPTSGANENVPSGTTYSWPSPVVTGGLSGGAEF